MSDPRPPEDLRKTDGREEPRAAEGGGAAYGRGYGAGGLSSGIEPHRSWDAPGVTPDGHRTGASTDGPRITVDGEGEPDPPQGSSDEA
jgi:hypothetical protein